MIPTIRSLVYLVCSVLVFSACTGVAQEGVEATGPLPAAAYIYWSDADSGHIRGIPEPIHFRLHDVDAPETRSPNQRGGAMCEAERPLGYAAKEFAVELTRDARIEIVAEYGEDRYDRLVIDLSVNGQDMATALIAAGHGQLWDYDGGQDKPKWCH
ncbi:MAG: thermonuclease family protein [Hyphomonadaceae bacterium]